jgi:putative membrane protein
MLYAIGSGATHMTEIHPADSADRFEVRVTADSHFGWIRTRLSLERTMMSWVRTATALIGFGFAIVQYLDRLQQLPDTRMAYLPNAPRGLGLALIGCGILALVVSLYQYWWTARYLSGGAFAPIARMKAEGMQSPVVAIAVLLICIGLFAFFAVLLRVA